MPLRKLCIWLGLGVLACLADGGGIRVCAQSPAPGEGRRADAVGRSELLVVNGLTKPHRSAELAALQPAQLVELRVREGELVSVGRLMAVLDDGVQRLRTEIARAAAESTNGVDLARVEMERAVRDMERLRELIGGDYATDKELQDAESEAKTARLKFAQAKLDRQERLRQKEREELLLARLHLVAPFAGYVAEVFKEPGETLEDSEPVLRLVQLDPLEVVLDCPLALAGVVREGATVEVKSAGPVESTRRGRIYFASRVADPASQTFRVKLLLDNPEADWMAGVKVVVDFSTAAAPTEHALKPVSVNDVPGVSAQGQRVHRGDTTNVR